MSTKPIDLANHTSQEIYVNNHVNKFLQAVLDLIKFRKLLSSSSVAQDLPPAGFAFVFSENRSRYFVKVYMQSICTQKIGFPILSIMQTSIKLTVPGAVFME